MGEGMTVTCPHCNSNYDDVNKFRLDEHKTWAGMKWGPVHCYELYHWCPVLGLVKVRDKTKDGTYKKFEDEVNQYLDL